MKRSQTSFIFFNAATLSGLLFLIELIRVTPPDVCVAIKCVYVL